jgi:hypothetical protein
VILELHTFLCLSHATRAQKIMAYRNLNLYVCNKLLYHIQCQSLVDLLKMERYYHRLRHRFTGALL